MPPFGSQNGTIVFPPWSGSPPLYGPVPKWPQPNTPRVDGRLRWNSDPDGFPIATRYVGQLLFEAYSTVFPFELLSSKSHWFWFDLVYDSGLRWVANSGVSASGMSFDFSIEYTETLPHLGVPGVRQEFVLHQTGEPDASWPKEWTNATPGYPLNYVGGEPIPDWEDVPGLIAGATWNSRRVSIIALSECFPVDQLSTEGGDEVPIKSLVYVAPGGQSIAGGAAIAFQNSSFLEGPTIWVPASPTLFTIPASGVSWIKFWGQVRLSASNNSWVIDLRKGADPGIAYDGRPYVQDSPAPVIDRSQDFQSAWIPVMPGDFFRVHVTSTVGTVGGGLTWVAWETLS